MEYVEGAPIAPGGGFRRILDLAAQTAAGLAAAHAAGIVHRDLKPDNVLVTSEGVVKILDFGLAKRAMRASAGEATQTVVMGTTDPGTVLGTVFYMSPEQARGAQLDTRSDQFSLGLILYELAAGKRAFVRESAAQTMSAIIEAEPDYSTLAGMPAALRWIVERCLAKNPRDRYDSTGDLWRDLEQLKRRQGELSMSAAAVEAPRIAARSRRWIAGAALIAAIAGAVGWFGRALTLSPPARYRMTPVAVDTSATLPAWSPDGKVLAYSQESGGYYQIFARRLDQRSEAPAQLTTLHQDCLFPFWSPAGDRIYFNANFVLFSVGAAGGQPEKLMDQVEAATISPDGKTLVAFRIEKAKGALWSAQPDGRNPSRVLEIPSDTVRSLAFAPDGKRIVTGGYNSRGIEIFQYPFHGSPRRWLGGDFRLPADSFIQWFSWMPDNRHFVASVVSGFSSFSLWRGDVDSKTLEPLTNSEMLEYAAAVSPDGARIAFGTFTLNWDILQVDFATGTVKPLIKSARYDGWPACTPSGEQVVFTTNRRSTPRIWLKSVREGWERPLLGVASRNGI